MNDRLRSIMMKIQDQCTPDTAGLETMNPVDAYSAGVSVAAEAAAAMLVGPAIDGALTDDQVSKVIETFFGYLARCSQKEPGFAINGMREALRVIATEGHGTEADRVLWGELLASGGRAAGTTAEMAKALVKSHTELREQAGGMQMTIDELQSVERFTMYSVMRAAEAGNVVLTSNSAHRLACALNEQHGKPIDDMINMNDSITFIPNERGRAWAESLGRSGLAKAGEPHTMLLWEFANYFGGQLFNGMIPFWDDCNFKLKRNT